MLKLTFEANIYKLTKHLLDLISVIEIKLLLTIRTIIEHMRFSDLHPIK